MTEAAAERIMKTKCHRERYIREKIMIVSDAEIEARYESPLNLLHRLRDGMEPTRIISIPPKADDVIDDLTEKLKHAGLKTKAAAIMNDCLDELKNNIDAIKPGDLAKVINEMNKVVTAQTDKVPEGMNAPQIIVYAPSFLSEEHFETIYVKE